MHHVVETPTNEKAARPCQVQKAATNTTTPSPYPASRPTSRGISARPCAAAGLGLLLAALAVQGGMLGPRQQRRIERHANRWVAQIVEARHQGEA
jgi:hypothetical protein